MNDRKRRCKEANQQISDSVATAQQQVAAPLLDPFPKKQCLVRSVKVALGAQVVPSTHSQIIPKQTSIDAALSKLVAHAGLRAANNARLTTAIADMCMPITYKIVW